MYVSEKGLKVTTQKYKSLCYYGGNTYFFPPCSQIFKRYHIEKIRKTKFNHTNVMRNNSFNQLASPATLLLVLFMFKIMTTGHP